MALTTIQKELLGVTDFGKTNVEQTWTAPQIVNCLTDNDLSLSLAQGPDFSVTPTAGGTLTFTNLAAGKRGMIVFNNTANYSIAKGAMIKAPLSLFNTISTTGLYQLTYWCYDGTNVIITSSGALS